MELFWANIQQSGGTSNPLWNGLTSYYRFDETSGTTVADVLNLNNATASLNTWVTGKNNNGIRLNNASFPYVRSAKRNYNYNNPFSFSLWLKREAISFYFCWLYVGSKQQSPYGGIRIGFNNVNKLHMQMTADSTNEVILTGDLTLTDTTMFHHIVVTYSATGTAVGFKYYLDGVQSTYTVTKDTLFSKNVTNSGTYDYFGQVDSLIAYNPQAIYDEYGFWNRILSSNEVATLYNMGAGRFY